MKSIRGFALGLALGLAAAISTIGVAQNEKPAVQDRNAESCCAMTSCCCNDGSCPMKGKDHAKEHSKDGTKSHSGNEGCCCCSGDSCDLKMKTKMKEGANQR
jgi:hypothetical protein